MTRTNRTNRKEERDISKERSAREFSRNNRPSAGAERVLSRVCAYEARRVKDVRADVLNYAQTNHFGTIEARKYSCAMTRPVLGNSIYVTVPPLLFTRVSLLHHGRVSLDSTAGKGEERLMLLSCYVP